MIEAAIHLAAEQGLTGFSMKSVSDAVDATEASVYKHFQTRENLLYECYLTVSREYAGVFHDLVVVVPQTGRDADALSHNLWLRLFRAMVRMADMTIFLHMYRRSVYYRVLPDVSHLAAAQYYEDIYRLFHSFSAGFDLNSLIPENLLYCYLLDVTGNAACRVITGSYPDTPETAEAFWLLISRGVAGIAEKGAPVAERA